MSLPSNTLEDIYVRFKVRQAALNHLAVQQSIERRFEAFEGLKVSKAARPTL